MSELPRIAIGVQAHSTRHGDGVLSSPKNSATSTSPPPQPQLGDVLPQLTPTSSHPETTPLIAKVETQVRKPSKKYRRRSLNGKKKERNITEESNTTTTDTLADDESSVSSYSSSGSDESSRSQATNASKSRKQASMKHATLKNAISATALQTATEAIQTGSAKIGECCQPGSSMLQLCLPCLCDQ